MNDEIIKRHATTIAALRAELAQARVDLSGYLQAMGYLSGLAPNMAIDVTEPMRMAETIYAEVNADLAAARARIAELEAARRWVSTKEQLPEEDQLVLARCDSDTYLLTLSEDCWFEDGQHLTPDEWPTHWQPLPEPPEGEGE